MMQTILTFFVAINLATLAMSILDKGFAVYGKRRVPEGLLLTMAFFGGALGAKLAQILTGHKRLKTDFCASLTLIAFLQLGAAAAVWSEKVRFEADDGFESVFARSGQDEPKGVTRVSRDREMPRRFGPGS